MSRLLAWLQSAQSLPDDWKVPVWVKNLLLTLGGPLGLGAGLFVSALIDSSFFPLPFLNEILVVGFSLQWGLGWALFFALMATLGSTIGCLIIYSIGYKGGELLLKQKMEEEHLEEGKLKGVHAWLDKNEFMAVLVSSFLPPPMPFKLFVLAAGGFKVGFKNFVTAILLGRGLRFFSLAILGSYFGLEVFEYIKAHPYQVALIALASILGIYFLSRLATRRIDPPAPDEEAINVPSQTAPNVSKPS